MCHTKQRDSRMQGESEQFYSYRRILPSQSAPLVPLPTPFHHIGTSIPIPYFDTDGTIQIENNEIEQDLIFMEAHHQAHGVQTHVRSVRLRKEPTQPRNC
eukprot:TRINITY_DN18535_c1_g1_i1.p2 TRINITY_DN18535_c1_g1~~TRINITY_DN18535_c1_g1_i1.p2  ORF type:complete len:100 (+),score=12.70 TRINITY_DN18535_c1_g1_i1:750-1049(+)